MDHAPDDWDFLYLNHNRLVGEYASDRFWFKPKNMPEKPGTNALANAYMLRPAGAVRMLRFQSPISYEWSNDSNMRRNFDKFSAYFLVEALVHQTGSGSVRIKR